MCFIRFICSYLVLFKPYYYKLRTLFWLTTASKKNTDGERIKAARRALWRKARV